MPESRLIREILRAARRAGFLPRNAAEARAQREFVTNLVREHLQEQK
jgi:hypothetical protein